MSQRLLRVVFAFEFLLAVLAIFTAWSEIGGQAALDLMHWGWKSGIAVALASSIVGFTAALEASEHFWTLRSARWLVAVLTCLVAAGVVTYFYSLQVDQGDGDESGTLSTMHTVAVFGRPS